MPVSLRPLLPSTSFAWGVVLLAVSTVALAQGKGIYTCVDSHGRRITSDRPITECLDREQHELTSSGTLKRVVPPSYTADERARIDAQKKAEEALQARLAEEKRRDRALLIRYPNQAVHDRDRKLEDNEQQVVVQQRFVVEQTQEKRRVNARFDEELVKLRQLWGQK